jgi:hypothetical protein
VSVDVSEEHVASIFGVEEQAKEIKKSFICLTLVSSLVYSLTLKMEALPKRRLILNRLHGVISQKMLLFITTAVRTSNPTGFHLVSNGTLIHSAANLWSQNVLCSLLLPKHRRSLSVLMEPRFQIIL